MNTKTRRAIAAAALEAAKSAAASDHVDMRPSAARPVANRVAQELEPIVDHLTNAEAWWQSRVTLGSLTGIVGGAITIGAGIAAGSLDPELYAGGLAAFLGGGFALYGRWMAARPLGR